MQGIFKGVKGCVLIILGNRVCLKSLTLILKQIIGTSYCTLSRKRDRDSELWVVRTWEGAQHLGEQHTWVAGELKNYSGQGYEVKAEGEVVVHIKSYMQEIF